jgi:hypothetical protein
MTKKTKGVAKRARGRPTRTDKRPRGRPTVYSAKLAHTISERLAGGPSHLIALAFLWSAHWQLSALLHLPRTKIRAKSRLRSSKSRPQSSNFSTPIKALRNAITSSTAPSRRRSGLRKSRAEGEHGRSAGLLVPWSSRLSQSEKRQRQKHT